MLILCGFEGCRGGNFSRPYRNFYPPPREFLPPPLGKHNFPPPPPFGSPGIDFFKINSGSGENYASPPGVKSFILV